MLACRLPCVIGGEQTKERGDRAHPQSDTSRLGLLHFREVDSSKNQKGGVCDQALLPRVSCGANWSSLRLLYCLQVVCGPLREITGLRTPQHTQDAACASPRLISPAARTPRSSLQTSMGRGVGTSSSGKSTPASS